MGVLRRAKQERLPEWGAIEHIPMTNDTENPAVGGYASPLLGKLRQATINWWRIPGRLPSRQREERANPENFA